MASTESARHNRIGLNNKWNSEKVKENHMNKNYLKKKNLKKGYCHRDHINPCSYCFNSILKNYNI